MSARTGVASHCKRTENLFIDPCAQVPHSPRKACWLLSAPATQMWVVALLSSACNSVNTRYCVFVKASYTRQAVWWWSRSASALCQGLYYTKCGRRKLQTRMVDWGNVKCRLASKATLWAPKTDFFLFGPLAPRNHGYDLSSIAQQHRAGPKRILRTEG